MTTAIDAQMPDATPQAEQDPRARRTLQRVTEGLESGAVAGIAEIVKLVEALAANALKISVSELAELIEKDVVVTAKVVSAANMLGYNPSGIEVSSITQAIHVIGFSKIRTLALSLMLMENAERSQGAAVQRDTATLALTSGMMAQSWAEAQGRNDGEQAFLCGSLRNFGRLLMSALMPEDDNAARAKTEVVGDVDAAYRQVFGLTPLELGYELLKSSNLPEPLLQGLRQFSPSMLDAKMLAPADELLVAAEFSVRMSQLVLSPGLTPTAFGERSRELLQQFGKHLQIDAEVMKGIYDRAEQRMTAFGQAFGLQSISRGVTQRLSARRQGRPVPGGSDGSSPVAVARAGPADAPKVSESSSGSQAAEGETAGELATAGGARLRGDDASAATAPQGELPRERRPLIDVLHETMSRCAEMLGQPVVNEEAVATAIVTALLEGWAADEAVLLLERGKGSFALAAGAGKRWREFRGKMGFRRDERNVFGVAAARCEPVLIHDAADPKIDPYLPPWLKAGLQLYSCVIVPGGDASSSHSVLFIGWRVRQKLAVAPEELRSLRALLGMANTARRLAGM